MNDEVFLRVKDYALRLLSFRPRSIEEITYKLKLYVVRKKFPDSVVNKVLRYLSDLNLINDREFASWWIEQRRLGKPKGKKAIYYELIAKGIDRSIITDLLDKDHSQEDEVALAAKIAEKKYHLYKNLPAEKLKIKISDALSGRGFTYDVIKKVIDLTTLKR